MVRNCQADDRCRSRSDAVVDHKDGIRACLWGLVVTCVGASLLLLLAATGSLAEWPDLPDDLPSIDDIEDAASDSGWVAGANVIWNLTWQQKIYYLGCILPDKSEAGREPTSLRGGLRDLPDSWDWRDVDDVNHMSSVKNQGSCGSCWAFAACGVLEAIREIGGLTDCGFEDLSEQYIVSCSESNGGCEGGSPDDTANFLRDEGTPDENCFAYQTKDSTDGVPCTDRCDDWSDRLRKITSWSYVRDGGVASHPGAIDSLKQAVHDAPQWVTMLVYADFQAYKSGIYRHVVGPILGAHAIVLVGYDDDNSCFICKNSWGANWGENGYFRIAYTQVYNGVQFGYYCVDYSVSAPGGGGGGWDYGYGHGIWDWRYGHFPMAHHADDLVLPTQLPFLTGSFCSRAQMASVSSNGWISIGSAPLSESWPNHFPIPDPMGPPSMIAPLWTDLDVSVAGAQILTDETLDNRFVIEYRNVLNKSTGSLETFEVVILDPAYYPTRTGDAILQFQYLQHQMGNQYFTVGLENLEQTTGLQYCFNGQGEPILPYTNIEFQPLGHGDEHEPMPASINYLVYDEPYVSLGWENPLDDVAFFPLLYLTGVVVERDGEPIAQLIGQPGETMQYNHRESLTGPHTYTVRPFVGERLAAPAGGPLSIPPRIDYDDHDVNQVLFTVTDQGTCGFLDANQAEGSGFHYPPESANCIFIGGLWAGASPQYALGRDYLADPFDDWVFLDGLEIPAQSLSDQDFRAVFDDAGHALPRGLVVTQDSWAWSDPQYDGFVVVRYELTNAGDEPIEDLYAGAFADWDIGADSWHNQGRVDPDLKMAYMWHDVGLPYVGIALLDTLPDDPPLANLSMIHNPTFVYPQSYILDEDRWEFLSGADPEHSVAASWQQDDWSVIASAGPFDLDPGESSHATFAFVGGEDEADLLANAVAANAAYRMTAAGVDDGLVATARVALLPSQPNPFQSGTLLRYFLPKAANVEVTVFDAAGRLVRVLKRGPQTAGDQQVHWDARGAAGRPVASGIYFIRLSVDGRQETQRVMRLR